MAKATPSQLRVTPPTTGGVADYPPGAAFGPRRMRDYEFVWLIAGHAEYHRDGRIVAACPPGSIILCTPGADDSFRWDPVRVTRHAYFHFNVQSVPRSWPTRAKWPVMRMPAEGDALRPMLRHVLRWMNDAAVDPKLLTRSVEHALHSFITGQFDAAEPPRPALPDAVELALKRMFDQLAADAGVPIHLAELAEAACVAPAHLCRLFRKHTGRSPGEAVRLARLDRAMHLVARSNCSVKEIAHLTGFVDQPHLTRRFTRAFGFSPIELRRRIAAGERVHLPRLLNVLQLAHVNALPR